MITLNSNITKKNVGEKIFITKPIAKITQENKPMLKSESNIIQENKKIVRQKSYTTNGEILILVKDIDECELILNSYTTNHIIVKALTKVIIRPYVNLIDEFYEKIEINKGACVEFYLLENNWYIVSSDGLKLE